MVEGSVHLSRTVKDVEVEFGIRSRPIVCVCACKRGRRKEEGVKREGGEERRVVCS